MNEQQERDREYYAVAERAWPNHHSHNFRIGDTANAWCAGYAAALKDRQQRYVHLLARGKDKDAKVFTRQDVEALVSIGLALEREKAKRTGQWTCWKCRQVNSAGAKTCGRCEDQ